MERWMKARKLFLAVQMFIVHVKTRSQIHIIRHCACIYLCVCVRVCVCVCVCMCMYACLTVCMCVCRSVCIYVKIMYVCMYLCMCCMYVSERLCCTT